MKTPEDNSSNSSDFPGMVPLDQPTFDIEIGDGPLGVDLRELYCELGSNRQFTNWAQAKLSQFVEGEDFEVLNKSVKNSLGGRPRKEYAVSIDCAKNIAMMEQTERGRQVRRYFIDAEKTLRQIVEGGAPSIPMTYSDALREAADQADRNAEQALLLEVQKPKAEHYDRYVDAEGFFCPFDAAKQLNYKPAQFVALCLTHKVLFRRGGKLQPYSKWMAKKGEPAESGYLAIRTREINGHARDQVVFTAKGKAWISNYLDKKESELD